MFDLITLYYQNSSTAALTIQALTVVGTVYGTGLLWSILKLILSSLGWFALGRAITVLIVKIAGIEAAAAATLTQVIVWEAQIAYQLAYYTTSCPNK